MNVIVAIAYAQRLITLGHIPFCPHLYHFVHRDWYTSPDESVWLEICKAWIPFCDAILRLEGESVGADNEVALGMALGIPIYYSIEALKMESHTA